MALLIEKGVPLPQAIKAGSKRVGGLGLPETLRAMDVGDSFLIPSDVSPSAISTYAAGFSAKRGTVFSVRRTDRGYRCWRRA